ncbi:MAG TPA: hypothetical protein VG722_13070 [Tepidisphaeraceae bacterium]|nr:hypothetical protein [Tepidisphaeraceae bacterium]
MAEDQEIAAMSAVSKALVGLEQEAVNRVLHWAADRYKVVLNGTSRKSSGGKADVIAVQQWDDLASLFAAADPKTDGDKALVVGYWHQIIQGQPDFEAQPVNTGLKHMGHGVTNITVAFSSLMNRKPSLIIQVQKTGSSKQARKKYKLTTAGVAEVERLLSVATAAAQSAASTTD